MSLALGMYLASYCFTIVVIVYRIIATIVELSNIRYDKNIVYF